jgi:hypothetical protein
MGGGCGGGVGKKLKKSAKKINPPYQKNSDFAWA